MHPYPTASEVVQRITTLRAMIASLHGFTGAATLSPITGGGRFPTAFLCVVRDLSLSAFPSAVPSAPTFETP